MQPGEEFNKGWDLPRILETNHVWMKQVGHTGDYSATNPWPVERLNEAYNCADLVISTSHAEGFGLPILEAMATKTLVMFPDHTSVTELIQDILSQRGLLIPCGTTKSEWMIERHDPGFPRPLVNIESMIEMTEAVMDHPPVELVENGYAWIQQNMNWDRVFRDFWWEVFAGAVANRGGLEGKVIQ